MSPRDIRAAKLVIVILLTIGVIWAVSSSVSSQQRAHERALCALGEC